MTRNPTPSEQTPQLSTCCATDRHQLCPGHRTPATCPCTHYSHTGAPEPTIPF